MSTEYLVYMVNNSESSKNFYCFLTAPEEIDGAQVFANSSNHVTLPDQSTGTFDIGIEYSLEVKAQQTPVEVGVTVSGGESLLVDLTDTCDATFTVNDEHQIPTISMASDVAAEGEIGLLLNSYVPSDQEVYNWYQSATFGIKAGSSSMGYTWTPGPNSSTNLTPKVSFYINYGDYTDNQLLSVTETSRNSAQLTNASFDSAGKTTVTINSDGTWTVLPGQP